MNTSIVHAYREVNRMSAVIRYTEEEQIDCKGGLGRFYEIFGEGYAAILTEMNLELVA